jgi:uncharacterized protein
MIAQWWLLLSLGLVVGTFGTLIGVGGGFVLVPVLIFLMPHADAVTITAISLAVVFLNATSGSIAYLKMGRVDVKSAFWFGLATLPGAILGVIGTEWFPRKQFNVVFSILLVIAAIYLIVRPAQEFDPEKEPTPGHTRRQVVDAEGTSHVYHFSLPLGITLSVFVGFISSLFGIGGGIVHVPVLNRTLNFPVRIATATSQVILGFMALVGTMVHLTRGNIGGNLETVALLGAGAVGGAQIGARLSNRIHGTGIIRILAITLGLVGIRILLTSLS